MRALVTKRWIAAHLLFLVLLTAFIELGLWQLRRLHLRQEANARITAHLDLPIAAPATLSGSERDVSYRRVRARGRYDTAREVVIIGRSFHDLAGNHVLTPLVLADGRALLVDRGWVPLDLDEPPVTRATPPGGILTVQGVLLPAERRHRFGPRLPPTGVLRTAFRIEIPRLRAQFPYEVLPLYVQLERQEPPQPDRLPEPVPFPRIDEGPHRSYAIQWFAFAAVACGTYGVMIRKALRGDARVHRLGEGDPSEGG